MLLEFGLALSEVGAVCFRCYVLCVLGGKIYLQPSLSLRIIIQRGCMSSLWVLPMVHIPHHFFG